MTGYAEASVPLGTAASAQVHTPAPAGASGQHPAGRVSVEMRSVNNRFLDLSLRLPDDCRGLEPALRELVAAGLRRGKVELRATVSADSGDDDAEGALPDARTLAALGRLQAAVQEALPAARPLSVREVLQWMRDAAPATDAAPAVLEAAGRCVAALQAARAREGERLAAFLRERVAELRRLAASAEPLVGVAIARQRDRFVERWHEALGAAGASLGAGATGTVSREAAAERALGEAAAFAVRIDVAEELARLRAHLEEVERLLAKGGEVGKRLDFLIQELLREANTLGSKAASLELTAVSVEMKVAIEQLREQVQNLE